MNNKFLRIVSFALSMNLLLSLFCISSLIVCEEQKQSMKILMVVACFPKIHDTCMLDQMTGLIDRGHEVHIFAFKKGDCIHVQEDVIKYDLINKTIFERLPDCLDEYDIIMFQLGHKLFDVRQKHNYRGKIVVCLIGYDITGFLRQKPHAYDTYFDKCDLFLPVCKAFKVLFQKEGCPAHKITVLYNGIDCLKFKFQKRKIPEDGTINIVSAGRFVEKKGFTYCIQAIVQLVKKYPRIHYTLIGDGILKEEYKRLIKELQIEDKVTFYGWLTHEEYIKILDQSHIFVLPSVTAQNNDQEGIPGVLKEAMAMGLPVVATDHSGNSELIEQGVSGFLVPERDSDAISETIEYLLSNPKKWKSIELAAVQKVHAKFEKEAANDRLEAILYKLLRQRRVKENEKIILLKLKMMRVWKWIRNYLEQYILPLK